MPRSPRWQRGKLWLFESGNGGVGFVDEASGKYTEVCRLPGFTSGMDFASPFAFVGLSQVRESATFSGIAIANTPQADRWCGVWVIDLRTGQIAAFAKFTNGVQEIFAMQAIAGSHWPEVLNEDARRIAESYEFPKEVLQKVPVQMRAPSSGPR